MRKTKKILAICCCLFMTCFLSSVQAEDIPEPTKDFYVNDYANMLDTASKDHIMVINNELYETYEVQLVVATVEQVPDGNMEDYAYKLFNKWKIGTSKTNRGILLLLSKRDDDYWIMQGKGLTKTMPSSELSDILSDNLEADFAKKEYGAGVTKTVDALVKKVESSVKPVAKKSENTENKNTSATTTSEEESSVSFFDMILGVVGLVAIIFGYRKYRQSHPKQPKQPKEPKEKIVREVIVEEPVRRRNRYYDDYYYTDPRYYDDPRYYNDPYFYNDPRYRRHSHLYHHHHHHDHEDNSSYDDRYEDRENRTQSSHRPSGGSSYTPPRQAPRSGQGGSTSGGGAGRKK